MSPISEAIDAELVLLATGVAPNGELAASAGLELHDGAIPVDASMRSADRFVQRPPVDVAWAENRCAGRRLRVEHWGDALAQGEVAGRALAHEPAVWDEVPGFWSTIGDHARSSTPPGATDSSMRASSSTTRARSRSGTRRADVVVGVLTHERDEDYERGREPDRPG